MLGVQLLVLKTGNILRIRNTLIGCSGLSETYFSSTCTCILAQRETSVCGFYYMAFDTLTNFKYYTYLLCVVSRINAYAILVPHLTNDQ